MAKGNDNLKTLTVAGLLCVVCSILVSFTVVTLKPKQLRNADLDYKKNVLNSAGLLKPGMDIDEEFAKIETILVDFETGEVVTDQDAAKYDQVAASKVPATSIKIPTDKDIAGLSNRAKTAKVFLTRDDAGKIKDLILNVRGIGLWSTMYGFLALESDGNTIKGFGYYAQGETPGLGAEVNNPKWKKQWIGKKVYGDDGKVAFKVAKSQSSGNYEVDGISGATITTNGVTSSMKYWFGDHAYGKFLAKVKAGEI